MIRAQFGIETISPGSMLRHEKRSGSALGAEAHGYTSGGGLVPDALIIALVRKWLNEHGDAFVFDGYPRTIPQAEALEVMLAEKGLLLDVVFLLEIGTEQIKERVLRRMICQGCGAIVSIGGRVQNAEQGCPRCGGILERRRDDTLEALATRMAEYRAKSAPLAAYYSSRNLLQKINAAQTASAVFAEIDAHLQAT